MTPRGRSAPFGREHPGGADDGYGAFPWLALVCAVGLAIIAAADALSRTGHGGGSILFWVAVVLIVGACALRMAGTTAGRRERIATVVLMGLTLYAIKVLQNPFAFTYADELVHLHNVQAILGSKHLFNGNSLLPITPRYPGLETVTAALARAGGISPFAAGLILIGSARVLMMIALYLLYELVSGSPRSAGLGVVVYAATPTFLFFTAEFSYESLALPLAVIALYTLVRSIRSADRGSRLRWAALCVLLGAVVVVTHHITTYVLVAFVVGLSLLQRALRRRERTPWAAAGAITALGAAWLAFAAGGTIQYLSPVVGSAIDKVVATLNGASPTRVLFANQGGIESTPTSERAIAVLGILLLVLGVAAGLRVVWGRWRERDPVVLLMASAAVVYLATLPLRFVPAAWETASRTGEFLFVGVGLTVSAGLLWLISWATQRPRLRRLRPALRGLAATAVVAIFASGAIAGWPASLRLAQPLRVKAAGHTIEPPGYVAARWSGEVFGSTPRVAAEDSDARLFLDYAHQVAFTDDNPNIDSLLSATRPLDAQQRKLLASLRITLLETDRRKVATDIIAGYFFDSGRPALTKLAASSKFARPGTDRVLAGGDFAIYGVRGLW